MRRAFSLALMATLACAVGLAQDARAGVTVDVVFQDATVPTGITIVPGDPGPGCTFSGYYGGSVATGYCMDVILMSTEPIIWLGISVQYDNNSGIALGSMYQWRGIGVSFDKQGMVQKSCLPSNGLEDHGPGFGSGVGLQSFNCMVAAPNAPPQMDPGTYKIGTIIWDTSATTSTATIAAAIDPLIDGVIAVRNGYNIVDISSQVVLGSHLVIVPEPGTAALLGLGFVGLILAARRKG